MIEIRIHGRGGQGSVTLAEILAIAAFYENKYAQAFPSFGVERRGAPVQAFLRIDDKPILIRSHIYNPDYVIVQDPTLIGVVNVTEGLKKGGVVLINTERDIKFEGYKTFRINATRIALETLGVPIVNTAMAGAFVALTDIVSFESLKNAIRKRLPERIVEKNIKAAELAYMEMKRNLR